MGKPKNQPWEPDWQIEFSIVIYVKLCISNFILYWFLKGIYSRKVEFQLSLYWFFFGLYFYLTGAIFLEVLRVTLLLKITRHNITCAVSLIHLVALCFTNVQVVEGMDLLNEKTKAEIRNLKRVYCFNLSKPSSNITYCLADFVILICCIILLFSGEEEKWEKTFTLQNVQR